VIRTIKLKVYPDDYGWLNQAARAVNRVFNYCNEVSQKQYDYWRACANCKPLSSRALQEPCAGYARNAAEVLWDDAELTGSLFIAANSKPRSYNMSNIDRKSRNSVARFAWVSPGRPCMGPLKVVGWRRSVHLPRG
jgi:hypothetical protein